jgi:hypothetical protein
MEETTKQIIAGLEREWPRWQVWCVYRVVGGPVWCARPWAGGDDGRHTLNASSPEELEQMLEMEAEAQR